MDVGSILDLIAGPLAKRFPNLKRNERSLVAVSGNERFSVRVKLRTPKTVATKAKRPAKKAAA